MGTAPPPTGNRDGIDRHESTVICIVEKRVGVWLGPGAPHEGKHRRPYQVKYVSFPRCKQLTGVDSNPHKHKHSKKTVHLPCVNGLGPDSFTSKTTSRNVLEHAAIKLRTCGLVVGHAKKNKSITPAAATLRCGLARAASGTRLRWGRLAGQVQSELHACRVNRICGWSRLFPVDFGAYGVRRLHSCRRRSCGRTSAPSVPMFLPI